MVNGMKHTEIGDIPENWQVQTFEETFKVLPNNTLPRADLNNRGGSVRNVHYGDILVRFPEVLDCKTEDIPYLNDTALITANAQFLQDGDVLLADTAEDEAVGKATEIYGLGDGKMVAGLHTIPCRVKKGDFAPKWLGYYMNSHAYHNQIMPYVTGIKVSSISKSAIAETLVLVPPKQEQEAIVAALSDIDTLIANLEKMVAKYQMIILLKQLYAMFDKHRMIDLIENFVVFDKGIKKVCRYNQYYGIKRTQRRIVNGKGGIIWHTQGSGKTLTMVWLSKWLLTYGGDNVRVLIVTDRDELDEQIEKTYIGVNEKIVRTKSGDDLIRKLNKFDDVLICSLIHKFGRRGGEVTDADYDKYIEELAKALPEDFEAKGKLYVFVDECHRTQSGKLHSAMKAIMPKAIFIGFTGTPLLVKDKKTSIEVFGTYIHSYKYNEAVRDGIVLDLRYEYRDIPQELSSQDRIDQWFDIKTRGLSARAKAKLKGKWANMQKIYSSRSRLEKIAWDIIQDFDMKPRLMDGNGNAILVADSIYSACKYYEIFIQRGFKKCAIISSYTPQPGDLRTDTVSDEDDTETFEKYDIYLQMLGLDPKNLPEKLSIQKTVDDFEASVKKKFVEQPANMKLLIVVNKLLTGFDAPPCTYLYIDKNMHDHGLFQAICRVNRLDDDTKVFGFIVDYKQLFGDLKSAMDKYNSGAFEGYAPEDVDGLLKNRSTEAIKYFKECYDELVELCEGVKEPREDLQYMHYFCGESGMSEDMDEIYARLREKMYNMVSRLVRAFAEAKQYLIDECTAAEMNRFENGVKFYIELKQTIGNRSGDFLDYRAYEPDMRKLIDNYIVASDSVKIGEFDDLTLLDFVSEQGKDMTDEDTPSGQKESAAEAIENNIRRKVVEKITVNPRYYERMSEILNKLIQDRKQGVLDYKALLEKYIELAKNVEHPEDNDSYPESIRNSKALQAIYDNIGENEAMALKLHSAVLKSKLSGFRGDPIKERRIKGALFALLNDADDVERVYRIIEKQEEY